MGWLSLTRKPLESVTLSDGNETIVVKVIPSNGGSQVRLGFLASQRWKILRTELLDRSPGGER